jgi:hypothetical protein
VEAIKSNTVPYLPFRNVLQSDIRMNTTPIVIAISRSGVITLDKPNLYKQNTFIKTHSPRFHPSNAVHPE